MGERVGQYSRGRAASTDFDTTGEFSTNAPPQDRDTEMDDRGIVRTGLKKWPTDHNEFASGIDFAGDPF